MDRELTDELMAAERQRSLLDEARVRAATRKPRRSFGVRRSLAAFFFRLATWLDDRCAPAPALSSPGRAY